LCRSKRGLGYGNFPDRHRIRFDDDGASHEILLATTFLIE